MTNTTDLIDRLKRESRLTREYRALFEECIAALQPVDDEEVKELIGHLNDMSQFGQSTPAVAAALITRLHNQNQLTKATLEVCGREEYRQRTEEIPKLKKRLELAERQRNQLQTLVRSIAEMADDDELFENAEKDISRIRAMSTTGEE